MTERQINNRMKKIEELEAQKKALEEQISFLKAEVQESMEDAETLETTQYIIRWTKVSSERFDSKAFKSKHAELFQEYVKSVESRRFTFATK